MVKKSLSIWNIPLDVNESIPAKIDPKEIQMGIHVEKEHTSNKTKAKKIAMEHLREHPKYYSKLKTIFND